MLIPKIFILILLKDIAATSKEAAISCTIVASSSASNTCIIQKIKIQPDTSKAFPMTAVFITEFSSSFPGWLFLIVHLFH